MREASQREREGLTSKDEKDLSEDMLGWRSLEEGSARASAQCCLAHSSQYFPPCPMCPRAPKKLLSRNENEIKTCCC